jgi:uncharacterized protein (TIGR02145 family)
MKVTSSNTPSWDGTNTSGFSALPAGYAVGGFFNYLGTNAYFWSATENNMSVAWRRYLAAGSSQSNRSSSNKSGGFSVRCLQN